MYKANNYNGTIYEDIFNKTAIEAFVSYLASFSDENDLWLYVDCKGFFDNPSEMHKKILKTLKEDKDTFLRLMNFHYILPKYLSEEETFELYENTLNFLYCNKAERPNPEIEYCIAKSLLKEFDYIISFCKDEEVRNIEDFIHVLNGRFNDFSYSSKEKVDAINFVKKIYNNARDAKLDIIGISEKEAEDFALKKVIKMFTNAGLIEECFHGTDYELIDEDPAYAKLHFHSSLDKLVSTFSDERKTKIVEEEELIR